MKRLLFSFGLSLSWLLSVGQGTITTSPPLTPNNGSGGITFQVSSNTPTEITGISNIFSTGETSADVWIRVGGVSPSGAPNVSTAGGWTQVITGAAISGANNTALVAIPFGSTKIQVPANTPIGIHIVGNTRYMTGTAANTVTYTDGTFTVNVSDSVAYGGNAPSPTFNPRRFVGSVTYALAVTGNCTPFTGFLIDSISADAAKISWTPGTGNTGYKLEYGAAGFTPGTGTTVTGTYPTTPATPPVVLTGLTANTNYDVYLEEYCNSGTDTVGFPSAQGFTTTKLCAAPTAFTDSNLTANTVDLGWAQAGTYTEAWILYGPAGTNPGSAGWMIDTVMSPMTTHTLTGLLPSTAYDIYLATNCGAVNGVSDTVGPISIATPIQGPQGISCTTGSPGLLFSDDFESQGGWTGDFGTGATATNWNYRTGGTGSGGTGPNGAHSGSQYIYTETSGTPGGANIEAISPRIDLSTSFNSAELSFWLHAYGTGIDTIRVQVGNSVNGPWNTVFTRVGQLQTANADPWQNVGVNLDAYVGQAIHLRFLVIHGSGFQGDVAVDLVEVNSCQTCPFPSSPNLTFVSSDSASFNWMGSGTSYAVNWGPAGFTQGSPSSFFDSTMVNSLGLGGLNGNTAYDLYIRNDCSDSGNGFSGWVGPVTFVTLCNPLTAPYSNNFDNDSIDQAPICWDNFLVGGTNLAFANADVEAASTFNPAQSSPNYVRFYNYNTDTTWLISPQFSDLDSGNRRISFYGRTNSTFGQQWVEIGTISTPGDRASYVAVDSFLMTTTWSQYNLDMTTANGYNGTHEFIVFNHAADGNFRTIYLDDFVYEVIPPCVPPLSSSLGVDFVTATTAEVFWGSGSDGDTTFVEWGLPGFTPGSGQLGRAGVGGAVDSFLITGLTAETDYEFYVQDSCATNGNSPYIGPFAFKTSCDLTTPVVLPLVDGFENYTTGPDFTSQEFFCNTGYGWDFSPDGNGRGRLQAGTGFPRNGLQAWTMDQNPFFSGGTTNFMTMSVNLSNYTNAGGIVLSFYYMNHGNPIHPDNKVWVRGAPSDNWIEVVDLNQLLAGNGQWDSIVELDILASISGAGQTIGANTQIRWGQNGSSSAFSTTFSDGYTIDDVVLDQVSCPRPSGLTTSSLLDTAATLSWGAVGTATNYQVWFGPAGFYQGTTTTAGVKVFTTTNSYVVDTLTEQTCYEYLVRNACTPGDTSNWEGPFQFCTPCSPIFAPYYESWDGLVSQSKDVGCFGSIEDPGFANSNFVGVTIQSLAFYNPISSPNYVELDNSSNLSSPLMLVSPLTGDLTAGDKRVRFYTRDLSNFNTSDLIVGTITNPSDGSTFNPIDTIDPTLVFTEYIVELNAANGYNGTDMYFAFAHDLDGTFDAILIDDVNYERIPTCIRPDSLSVATSTITDTSATVSWVSNGGGSNFQIEFGTGLLGDPGNTRMLVSGASTMNLQGLTPGTGYCVWVREICTPGDTSFWRGPVCFATLCPLNGYMAPYFTNFEGITIGQASGSPAGWENCWTHSNTGSVRWESEDASGSNENSLNTGPFYDNTFYPAAGGTYMYLETSSSGGPAELISPLIDISGLNNPALKYHYHMFGATINYLLVLAEDANGNRTVIDSIAGQQQSAQADSFYLQEVPLTALTGTTYNFIFQGHRGTSFTGDISIDDVSVEEGSSCPAPTLLAASNITGTTADISWVGGSGTSWEIEYGVGAITIGTGTRITVTTNPHTLTGLSGSSNYTFFVREICAPGDTSAWGGGTFATPCVTTMAPYSTDFENIPIGVASGSPLSWNNCWTVNSTSGLRWESEDASGSNENSTGTGPFYDATLFPSSGGTYMYLETSSTGTSEDLVSPAIDFSSLTAPELTFHYHMFGATINKLEVHALDVNGNLTLIDSIVGAQQTAQSDSFFVRNVDLSTLPNTTYSFVFRGYRGTSFTGDISIDEVSVDNQGGGGTTCPMPTNAMATSNVGCDSVEVDWTSNTGGSIIQYGPAGFTLGTGTFTGIVTAPYTITGLTPGTAYDVWVADTCAGDTSAYVPINVTTATGPLPVAVISNVTDSINGNQFIVYLDASGSTDATSYTWDFGNGVTGSGVMDTVVFLGNGTYTVVLTATNGCGSDTASFQVYVNIGLDENPLANNLNVFPNPASHQVNVSFREVGSGDVEIRLRDAQGREVMMIQDRMQSGNFSKDIDVSTLARGIYMVEVKSGGFTAHRRLSIR